jgi:hypothetical protein
MTVTLIRGRPSGHSRMSVATGTNPRAGCKKSAHQFLQRTPERSAGGILHMRGVTP